MKTKTFFKNFIFHTPNSKATTLNQISHLYINKALRSFFNNHNIYKLKDNQLFGIIFKIRFEDLSNKDNIRSMSTMIRADKTSFLKLTTLFKHLLALRMEDYQDIKANQIIFSFHIFSEDYKDTKMTEKQKKEIITKNITQEIDIKTKLEYMIHKNGIKIPLLFANNANFVLQLTTLNPEIVGLTDSRYKYKIILDNINNLEVENRIVLQEDNSICIQKFKDKIISIPKLNNKSEILIERSFNDEIYLIDPVNNELILYKNIDVNKAQGYIKTLKPDIKLKANHLRKFITFDFETIKKVKNNHYENIPVLLGYHDYNSNESNHIFLINDINNKKSEKGLLIQNLFENFLKPKYNGFKLYAHNLSRFDAVYLLMNLYKLKERLNIKIEALPRDEKFINIKIKYGYSISKKRYLYSIEIRDSLLMLINPLSKLIKYFLSEDKELNKYKDNSKHIIQGLIGKNSENLIKDFDFRKILLKYCLNDCESLAKIIFKFALLIFNLFKINIHNYPTISSLAFAIFRSKYLESDKLIPKISGKIYKDIKKAYTGGHVDVYKLYSNEEIHSYDVVSLYPTVMLNNEYPVGKITHFIGNILHNKLNYTLDDLIKKHAFVKCDIFIDKSINRPLYQTHILFKNRMRTMCVTGTLLNQWIYLPELMKYQQLINNKIRIIEDSIKEGYLFDSKSLFKNYVESLFNLKNSVNKNDPLYLISKILLNSLYGRFGLKLRISIMDLVSSKNIETFIKGLNVSDVIKITDNYSLVISEKTVEDGITLNSSVAIAAAVTSNARMYMAPLILDNELDILYTDTDSIKTKVKINEIERYKYLDHDNLGGLKYEYTFQESIYLTPKVYGGIINDKESLIKIKGFKDKVEFETLKNILINKESIKLNQEKWFKDWIKEEILIKDQEYTLSINDNKRIVDLKTFDTIPYHFDNYNPESDM